MKLFATWLLREIPLPPPSTRVLAVLLFFIVYFYVPTVRTCHAGLRWYGGGGLVTASCTEPAFSVPCVASSRFHLPPQDTEFLCRTWWHRPVRIINDVKRQSQVCEDTYGWLAKYDPARGCYCEYHSTLRHGACVMTDDACRELFGNGAIAYISDEDALGYPDQCRCDENSPRDPATGRCRADRE